MSVQTRHQSFTSSISEAEKRKPYSGVRGSSRCPRIESGIFRRIACICRSCSCGPLLASFGDSLGERIAPEYAVSGDSGGELARERSSVWEHKHLRRVYVRFRYIYTEQSVGHPRRLLKRSRSCRCGRRLHRRQCPVPSLPSVGRPSSLSGETRAS